MAITHHLKALRLAIVLSPLAGFAAGAAHAESLREALASAYTNNPNMASALLSVQSASEGIALAKSGKAPVIGGALTNTSTYSNMGGTQSTSNTTTLGLSYTQTLFDNLKTDAQIEQARAMSEVAAQALRNAEQNVLLSAANAYMSVTPNTQLVQLRQDNVRLLLQAQVQARDRLDVGEGTKIDVAQAEAQYAQAVSSYKIRSQ